MKNAVTMPLVAERGCSEHILCSSDPTYSVTIPVLLSRQNGIDYAVASMKVEEAKKISLIPSLDFEQELEEFTKDTYDVLSGGGDILEWQRPLDSGRERKIARYFWNIPAAGAWTPSNALIPGAIVLGDLQRDGTSITVHKQDAMGRTFAEIRLEFPLMDVCPGCGMDATDPNYPEPAQPYFSQCWRHVCAAHGNSVEPLQIIDGQHRTNGILLNNPEDDVPVVFLLRDQEEDLHADHDGFHKPVWNGVDSALQAEIFEKVNNEAKGLNKVQSRWIKVMLNAAALDPHETDAFELFARTGGDRPASRWLDMVKYHQKAGTQHLLESLQLPKISEQLLGIPGTGLARYAATLDPLSQIENFLEGAYTSTVSPMFTGAGSRPFRNHVRMERMLMSFDTMVQHTNALGAGLTDVDFRAMWDLHSVNWTGKATNWNTFREGGEQPANLFRKIWSRMWQPNGGSGAVSVAHTYTDSAGAAQSINWGDIVGRSPVSSVTTSATTAVVGEIVVNVNPPFNSYPKATVTCRITSASYGVETVEQDFIHTDVPATINVNLNGLAVGPLATSDTVEVSVRYNNQVGPTVEATSTLTL